MKILSKSSENSKNKSQKVSPRAMSLRLNKDKTDTSINKGISRADTSLLTQKREKDNSLKISLDTRTDSGNTLSSISKSPRSSPSFATGREISKVHLTKDRRSNNTAQSTVMQQPTTNSSTCHSNSSSASSITSPPTQEISPIPSEIGIISEAKFVELTKRADKALKEGKTYVLRHNQVVLRNIFQKRGWVELFLAHLRQNPSGKRNVTYQTILSSLPIRNAGESHPNYLSRCERYALSRLIEHQPVKFLWSYLRNNFDYGCHRINPSIISNKLLQVPFNTKVGILRQFQNLNWIWKEGVAEVYFPRSYIGSSTKGLLVFAEDYKNTACVSFLKCVIERCKTYNWAVVFEESDSAEIPFNSFEFALRHCYKLLNSFHNIDSDVEHKSTICQEDWEEFFGNHYLLTFKEAKIKLEKSQIEPALRNATILLESMKIALPQYELDGYHNLWMVKPSLQNCGRGLVITSDFEKIKSMVTRPKRHDIIQKYIERPLLIYKTKFDIRQWFLISSVKPLTVWLYRENYLRFSSKLFDLQDLHESVHITNFCIQRKYRVDSNRDSRLPRMNMWDNHTFQAYLRQIGKPDVYSQRIYPGMRKAIVATVLASASNMGVPVNSFEVFGADFVLTEEFTPWLLEINSCPDLTRSTGVTGRLVPRMFEDLLKVIIDRKINPNCGTGNFELIIDQQQPFRNPELKNRDFHVQAREIDAEQVENYRLNDNHRRFQIKGKSLPSMDMIRREMYQHLLGKNRETTNGIHESISGPNMSLTLQKNILFGWDERINTLIHFEDNNRQEQRKSTSEKIAEITKTLQRLTTGALT